MAKLYLDSSSLRKASLRPPTTLSMRPKYQVARQQRRRTNLIYVSNFVTLNPIKSNQSVSLSMLGHPRIARPIRQWELLTDGERQSSVQSDLARAFANSCPGRPPRNSAPIHRRPILRTRLSPIQLHPCLVASKSAVRRNSPDVVHLDDNLSLFYGCFPLRQYPEGLVRLLVSGVCDAAVDHISEVVLHRLQRGLTTRAPKGHGLSCSRNRKSHSGGFIKAHFARAANPTSAGWLMIELSPMFCFAILPLAVTDPRPASICVLHSVDGARARSACGLVLLGGSEQRRREDLSAFSGAREPHPSLRLATLCMLLFVFEGVDNIEWLVGNEKKRHIIVLRRTMFHFHSFRKPDKAAGSK